MLATLGNGEELRHLNSQEDWLKTAVVFGNELLSTTNADGTTYYVQTLCQSFVMTLCQIKLLSKFTYIEKSEKFLHIIKFQV